MIRRISHPCVARLSPNGVPRCVSPAAQASSAQVRTAFRRLALALHPDKAAAAAAAHADGPAAAARRAPQEQGPGTAASEGFMAEGPARSSSSALQSRHAAPDSSAAVLARAAAAGSAAVFPLLAEAHAVLGDAAQRRAYDLRRARALLPARRPQAPAPPRPPAGG
jgi:hypothetical protein